MVLNKCNLLWKGFFIPTVLFLSCKSDTGNQQSNSYLISANITGLKSDTVYLYNTLTNKKEPTVVKDGNFSFTGNSGRYNC